MSLPILVIGHLGVDGQSLFSLMGMFAFLALCGVLSVRRRTWRWFDLPAAMAVSLTHIVAGLLLLKSEIQGISAPFLAGPFIGFMMLYGLWRLAGFPPLRTWPWSRFGLFVTTSIFVTDVGIGILMPVPAGHAWILGGAGAKDALMLLPPFLTLAYWALLDCKSQLTICSRKCREANRCLFDNDGALH